MASCRPEGQSIHPIAPSMSINIIATRSWRILIRLLWSNQGRSAVMRSLILPFGGETSFSLIPLDCGQSFSSSSNVFILTLPVVAYNTARLRCGLVFILTLIFVSRLQWRNISAHNSLGWPKRWPKRFASGIIPIANVRSLYTITASFSAIEDIIQRKSGWLDWR